MCWRTLLLIGIALAAINMTQACYRRRAPKRKSVAAVPFVSRYYWGAKRSRLTKLVTPVRLAIIHHTDTPRCKTERACAARVRNIQTYHMTTKGWDDIGYSFLIGDDNRVYVGRGWTNTGAHSKGYNRKSIGIALIADFEKQAPNRSMISILRKLLAYGVANGHLTANYKISAHRDVTATEFPGQKAYDIIKSWSRYTRTP